MGDYLGLFDIVPSNFFSVLVSGNREIYVESLMLLHDLFKFELNIEYVGAVGHRGAETLDSCGGEI